MSELCVYSSEAPSVRAAWAIFEETRRRFGERVFAIAEDTGMPVRLARGSSPQFVGLNMISTRVPDGWMVDNQTHVLVPDRSTETGREWGARVDQANGDRRCLLPGMPDVYVAESGRRYEPGVRLMAGTVWVAWPVGVAGRYDPALWTERPVFDFVTAVEDSEPVVQEIANV